MLLALLLSEPLRDVEGGVAIFILAPEGAKRRGEAGPVAWLLLLLLLLLVFCFFFFFPSFFSIFYVRGCVCEGGCGRA